MHWHLNWQKCCWDTHYIRNNYKVFKSISLENHTYSNNTHISFQCFSIFQQDLFQLEAEFQLRNQLTENSVLWEPMRMWPTFPSEPWNSFTDVLKWNLTPFSWCSCKKQSNQPMFPMYSWCTSFWSGTLVIRAPISAPKTLANGVGDCPTTSTLVASPLLIPNAATSKPEHKTLLRER